jgi:hypothetical protein
LEVESEMKYFVLVSVILAFFIFNLSDCKGKSEEETQISQQAAQETGEVNTAKSEPRGESKLEKEAKESKERINKQKNQIKAKEEYVFVKKWDREFLGESISPRGITIDSNDFIYVADPVKECIRKYNSEGKLILKWGEKVKSIWGFGLTVDSKDFIYLTVPWSNLLYKCTSDGKLVKKWGKT